MGGARLLHGLLPARGRRKMKRDNEVPHGFTEEVKEVKSLLIRHLVRAEVQQEALQEEHRRAVVNPTWQMPLSNPTRVRPHCCLPFISHVCFEGVVDRA